MSEMKVMPGMVLIEDHGRWMTLWAVCGVRKPRKDGGVTATLRSFSGVTNGVHASAEATATFPGGLVKEPFYLVTAEEVMRGKWPERLKS